MIQARTGPTFSFVICGAVAAAVATMTLGAPDAMAQAPAKPAAKPAGKPDPKKAEEAKAAETKAAEDKAAEEKAAEEKKKADEMKAAVETPAVVTEPPAGAYDSKDVEEIPSKTYLFVGARYRGNVIPQFMLNLFVDEGATVYTNTIGIELDLRKDGFSLIPALSFQEYGTGDILFKEKGSKDIAQNYSFVNSSMKAIYATADLLWSAKISKNVQFEYGAGFGLGIIFGDLRNNWVFEDPNGEFTSSTNKRFAKCPDSSGVGQPQVGCNKAEHQNSEDAKVGGYTEKSWLNGGSKPVIFPWISFPQLGLRFKPVKEFAGRLGIGFGLTGFWFGLSGAYGLEQKPKP